MSDTNQEQTIQRIEIYIPKWVEMLKDDNEMKLQLIRVTESWLKNHSEKENDINIMDKVFEELPFIKSSAHEQLPGNRKEKEIIRFQLAFKDNYYYKTLSELTGIEITGEYQLISFIRELALRKQEFEEIHQALGDVKNTGYGIIRPDKLDIVWEEPVLIHNSNRFGVKMKASGPAIHLIKTDLESEIAPIVGSEQQAKDLMEYLMKGADKPEGIWEINIFGKTVEQLMDDEISSKLVQFSNESKLKLQKVIHRILDENKDGLICIII